MMMQTQACRFCGRQITLVKTVKGHQMPLDPEPNEAGNVIVERQPGGPLVAHVPKKGQPIPIGTRFMPHFATCPNLPNRRRR